MSENNKRRYYKNISGNPKKEFVTFEGNFKKTSSDWEEIDIKEYRTLKGKWEAKRTENIRKNNEVILRSSEIEGKLEVYNEEKELVEAGLLDKTTITAEERLLLLKEKHENRNNS